MNASSESNQWYAHWFDSSFYHILYKHRNHSEASAFIDALVAHLNPASECKMLDLACGKGRHTRALHGHGFEVTGVDLSANSIAAAQQQPAPGLHFAVHDIRAVYKPAHFNVVLSLFTSFGYFDDPAEDAQVVQAVADSLQPGGRFVLDFMNSPRVVQTLVPNEVVERDGIAFHITKAVEKGMIVKRIAFEADGKKYAFEERVRAHTLPTLTALLKKAGLQLQETFGSYALERYQEATSDRLILIAGKG